MDDAFTIVVMILFGFMFLLGLASLIHPRLIWKIFASWKATEEPTKAYFVSQRIAGLIVMLMIIGFFLLPYLGSRM